MEPSEGMHPDPFGGALAITGQKIAELASVAALVGQTVVRMRARKAEQEADGKERGNNTAQDTERDAQLAADRAVWAPVLDKGWRKDAGLVDTVRAWGAAVRWEDADASAAEAVTAAEERLRELHPYAMRNYDALRAEGKSRFAAMMEAVPDFALHPDPRPAPADTQQGRRLAAAGNSTPAPGLSEQDLAVTRRLMKIAARMNARSVAAGHGPVSPEAVMTALRTQVYGAPDELLDRVERGLRTRPVTLAAVPRSASPKTAATRGPGAASWPSTVQDGLAATLKRQAAAKSRASRGQGKKATTFTNARRPSGPAV